MTTKSKKLNVVVVDDIASMRTLVVQFLRKNQHIDHLYEASSGTDAIQKVKELQPDILLVDLRLQDMSGFEVLKEVKAISTTTSVYLFSAYEVEELGVFHKNGTVMADGFVHKSNLKNELEEMIKKELKKQSV